MDWPRRIRRSAPVAGVGIEAATGRELAQRFRLAAEIRRRIRNALTLAQGGMD